MQPETLKSLGGYIGTLWGAIGPLIGVIVGALLARSWSLRQWNLENRRDECRELLKEITHTSTVLIELFDRVGLNAPEARQSAWAAYLESLKVLYGRIFIARDVEREKLDERWPHSVHDFASGQINPQQFSDRVADIQASIVRMVMGRSYNVRKYSDPELAKNFR